MGSILHAAHATARPMCEAQALKADEALFATIRQATEPRRFVRSEGLAYLEVEAEYLGRVVVGCYYEPAQPARPTSAAVYARTGDPGEPSSGGECEVIEVWDHCREIGQSITDTAIGCMAAAVLAGRGVVL